MATDALAFVFTAGAWVFHRHRPLLVLGDEISVSLVFHVLPRRPSVILRTRPGMSAKAYAICNADEFQLKIDEGKVLGDNVAVDSDFRVILKSAVTTETIIPPSGMVEGDLLSTDEVVCYA